MNDIHDVNDDSIARVSRNDATLTALSTGTNNNRFTDRVADSLGRALQRNNHVTKLSLYVYNLTDTGNYNSLLTAIERSSTLEEITIYGDDSIHGRVADRFLNAMSSTVSIRKVELYGLDNLSTNPFLFLLRSPASDLELRNCTFADTSQGGCREIAAGFSENVSLQRLVLIDIASELLAASLNGVQSHPAIRHLTVEPLVRETDEVMVALSDGIGQVLSSTSTLTSLELCYFRFSASNFEPIVQGVRSNQTVGTLEIATSSFDNEATDKFVSLFQNNNPIRTFKVKYSNSFQDTPVGEVVSRILRSNDTLKNLYVSNLQGDVALILEALQNNATLKTLTFANSLDDADLASLQRSLPKLRGLKKLTFSISGHVRISANSLLQAFEGNGSLEDVEIIQDGGFELFNAEALAKIRSFCRRNKKLPSFLAAPVDTVSPSRASRHSRNDDNSHDEEDLSDPVLNLHLRPKAYFVAQKIEAGGNRMMFRDLMRLGDLIGGGESCEEFSSSNV